MNGLATTGMPTENRFLSGLFAPVTEEITAFDLPVTGRLPAELNGRYLRNGPNPMSLADPNYHWFVGPGMVHGVRLRNGRAEWYRNRWVRSKAVAESLGEQWKSGPIHNGMDSAPNTHIISYAGHTLALVEAGSLPYELTDELDTVGPCDFAGTLPAGFAAHTKADRRRGELHAIAYSFRRENVQHIVIDSTGKVSRVTEIVVADKPMMHDFALTEQYVVLYDLPITFSMDAVSAGREMPYVWNPKHEARVGLLRRDASSVDVRWFAVDPCFIFHTLNAYDDGDRVVVDMCHYEGSYNVSLLKGPGPVTLDRWTIDPTAGKVIQKRLDERFQEFPRVDERVVGRQHRYGYSTVIEEVRQDVISPSGHFAHTAGANVLYKHDLAAGTVEAHNFGRGAAAGEAVFAPASPDAAEDDGYVMAFVHSLDRGATDLVVLAAQDFTGEPVASVHLPARVPLGFHGSWIADR